MSVPECLFKKHGVCSGKIVVTSLQYFEKLRMVNVMFEVTADGNSHTFSVNVPFKASQQELLDCAFKESEKALDGWLSNSRAFRALKVGLEGKTVFEWNLEDSSNLSVVTLPPLTKEQQDFLDRWNAMSIEEKMARTRSLPTFETFTKQGPSATQRD